MNKRPAYSPEARERTVRIVLTREHNHSSRSAAIKSICSKIGCTPAILTTWVNKIEVDSGAKAGFTSDQAAQMKALERENPELKRANEILKKAMPYPLFHWLIAFETTCSKIFCMRASVPKALPFSISWRVRRPSKLGRNSAIGLSFL